MIGPWPIIKTHNDYETHIILPEFGETYFGDTDTMTPEEWRIVHMISAAPMLLAACKADDNYFLHIQHCHECRYSIGLCDIGIVLKRKARELRRAAIAQTEEAQ